MVRIRSRGLEAVVPASRQPTSELPPGTEGTASGQALDRLRELLQLQTDKRSVVSVYLTMPLDPGQLRGIPARVKGLLAEIAETAEGDGDEAAARLSLDAVGEALAGLENRWLGRGVVVVHAPDQDVFEVLLLPHPVPDRASLGRHLYLRPLLSVLQRSPAYHVVVADRRHRWIFKADPYGIEQIEGAEERAELPGSSTEWYGDQDRMRYNADERRSRQQRETAAVLQEVMSEGETEIFLLGGHSEAMNGFTSELSQQLHEQLATTFVIDPHTMTPATVHEATQQALADWELRRQQDVLDRTREDKFRQVSGVTDCVYQINQRGLELLLLPEEGTVPGYACDRCGTLQDFEETCQVCEIPARRVPDLLDEMAFAVMNTGGDVQTIDTDKVDTGDERFPTGLRRHT